MSERSLRPAVFLDRDGTLTAEGEWVTKSSELALLPFAAEAIALLSRAGYAVVLATNQSAVARGLVTEAELAEIHAHMERELARGGAKLSGIYHCPHHPTEGAPPFRRACECRKPEPGMLLAAARELGLDLSRSWVVGDAERDLLAGTAVGARGILVATGKGKAEYERLVREGHAPESFVQHVLEAAHAIAGPRERIG